jgi:hypothetical protein
MHGTGVKQYTTLHPKPNNDTAESSSSNRSEDDGTIEDQALSMVIGDVEFYDENFQSLERKVPELVLSPGDRLVCSYIHGCICKRCRSVACLCCC